MAGAQRQSAVLPSGYARRMSRTSRLSSVHRGSSSTVWASGSAPDSNALIQSRSIRFSAEVAVPTCPRSSLIVTVWGCLYCLRSHHCSSCGISFTTWR